MTGWMIVAGLASFLATVAVFARAALHAANFEKTRHRSHHGHE